MKQIQKIATTTALAALLSVASSCTDFLDQMPQSSITKQQALSQIETVSSMVDGLYAKYRNSRIARNGLVIGLGLDESQQGYFQLTSEESQAGYDRYNALMSPSMRRLSNVWADRFPYQVTAGEIIDALSSSENPTEQIKELLGVAHFFRGIGMFELSMFFGEVPISDPSKYLEIKRRPLADVWTYIINDFTKSAEYLPAMQADPKEITKGAALAMLGKAYMCAPESTGLRDYKKAQTAFENLLNLNRYSLESDYARLFLNDQEPDIWVPHSSEAIFELQFSVIWGDGDCNVWQWDTGSRLAAVAFTQGCYFAGWDFLVPTPWMYKMKSAGGVWEDGDPRREIALRYDFTRVAFADAVNTPDKVGSVGDMKTHLPWRGEEGVDGNVHDEKDPHIRKYEDVRTDEQRGDIKNMFNSGKNHPLIRLADIYLLYAECLHRTGESGLAGDKNYYVQLVRNRAWLSGKNVGASAPAAAPAMPAAEPGVAAPESASVDQFIRDIMDERVRELAFEGWRRIDLLRTGLYRELVSKHNVWASREWNGGLIPEHTLRYPIPQDEMLTNPDLSPEDQNPGYK